MQYREIKKNGDKLSVLGYGAMRFPTKNGKINEEEASKHLYRAIDNGVNYIDTAYPYHGGQSESFLGKALSKDGYREKVKIATKLPHWAVSNKAEMFAILDEQLRKLQTDYIDYYLIHAVNGASWEKCKDKGVIAFLDEALASGKIKNAGFSFHGVSGEFNKIVDDYDWTFCQIQYNYLDTNNQAGTAGLKYAASKDIAVVIMEPLRGGNLAKTPPKEVQAIWDKADVKRTAVDWSLSWIWNHPEVAVVLSGMSLEEHVKENLRIASESLPNFMTEKELSIVDEAAETFRRVMRVGCTACQYCMPCPKGVNIPLCFEQYNSYHTFGDKKAKGMYAFMNGGITTETSLASQCVNCGVCVKKCPQYIAIPEELAKVKKDMEGIMLRPMVWMIKLYFKFTKKKAR